MLKWLGRLYARRIVNVNINIVLAGALALGPTVLVVHLTHFFGLGVHHGIDAPTRLDSLMIGGITFLTDALSDVCIYYGLHWLANHWPRLLHLRGESPGTPHLTFFKDATLVQIERMMLSPMLYLLWLVWQYSLMREGISREWATVAGFCVAIGLTRTLHTLWMIRQDRRRRARFAALGAAATARQPTPAEAVSAKVSP